MGGGHLYPGGYTAELKSRLLVAFGGGCVFFLVAFRASTKYTGSRHEWDRRYVEKSNQAFEKYYRSNVMPQWLGKHAE